MRRDKVRTFVRLIWIVATWSFLIATALIVRDLRSQADRWRDIALSAVASRGQFESIANRCIDASRFVLDARDARRNAEYEAIVKSFVDAQQVKHR